MDVASFRAAYPAFTPEIASEERVAFHLRVAGKRLPPDRWGDMLEDGMGLYVAHKLTLEARANKSTDGTGAMDAAAGLLANESKTVGSVSVSRGYASPAAANAKMGGFAATTYGQDFWELMMIVGAGGIQI